MKVIIDIPNKIYNALTHTEFDANLVVDEMRKSIIHGTPIPDNATNGDVIMAMFPNVNVYEHNGGATYSVNNEYNFNATWWNAPYQKGGTTRKNCEYRHENGNCLAVGGFCTSIDDEHCQKGGK